MTKITQIFYQTKSGSSKGFLSLFVLLLMSSQMSWGQQVIGSFPVVDGGLEGQTVGALSSSPTANSSSWTVRDNSITGTIIDLVGDASNVRSGNKAATISAVLTNKYLSSPALVPLISASTQYTMQYYFRAPAAPTIASQLHISTTVSTGGGNQTSGTFVPNSWNKATRTQSTTATAPTADNWTGVRISTYACAVDDFVVYAGPLDITVPDSPTVPTLSGLNVSWTPPVAGVDGGGYIVVRYATNPNADNDPNVNGIYAVGNTITNGTGALVGTVVYIGIGTSFTDPTNVVGSYYKIYTVDKAFNYSNEIIAGPVAPLAPSTTWNGTTWSNGTPDSTLEAIIDGTYSGAAFDAKKLTVNSGSMTITSGTMTVQNEVINNAGANGIVFENDANLIQVNPVANQGNVVVKRNSSPLLLFDYTLWSSPVSGQNLAAFSPLTSLSPNRFYIYDSASDKYTNTVPVTLDPTTTNFTPGAGYLIRMPNTADAVTPTAYPGVFTGVPNNGDVPFTLSTAGIGGYNLVGNPYASPINLFTLQANNSTIIGNTFYMWRKTNGVGTAYCSYVPTSAIAGTYVSNGNAQSPITFVGDIQIGQGFFVSALTTGPLVFKNGQRVPNATSFFKTKQVAAYDKVWLNATNTAGDFSQMAVTYFEGATQGLDAFDGKYFNDSAFAFTSNINGGEYTIQGRPSFDVSDVVQLNFKTNVAGDYTIAIDHSEGVFATGQDVYLVDSKTGTETNLKSSSYSFTAASGVDNARFSLKFQKTLKIDTPAFNENSVTVYKNNGTLYINSGSVSIANVKVFDIQGRLIAEQKNVKANVTSVNNLKANQALIVQVISEDNTVVNKKVVN
jgi:hypothetical protein